MRGRRTEQITDNTFDADHPNPEHIEGVLYDPVERCAFVGKERADLGDWIIEDENGNLSIRKATKPAP